MIRSILLISLFLSFYTINAQEEIAILSTDIELRGTLIKPTENTNTVVLIISGSGNTDRDGNTLGINYTNNSLKMVAEALAENNIASLRYDKRGVGKSISDSLNIEKLTFEDYVNDAANWITYLKKDFDTVIVMGHSLGALIGTLATQKSGAHKLITLAGIASSGYETLKRQLSTNQPEFVTKAALPILEKLNNNERVDSVPMFLNTLFSPKLQGYLISWLSYDPKVEIKKLDIPVMVIQGTTDIQITVEEAQEMAKANTSSELVIIKNMNHVLKEIDTIEMSKNIATYSNPDLPLHNELMKSIITFIKK